MQSSVFSAPKKVEAFKNKKVVQVSCGMFHTVFFDCLEIFLFALNKICLTEDGEVYTWGSSRRGVLGFKSEIDEPEPKKLVAFENKKIIKIDCGADYNLALTEVRLYYNLYIYIKKRSYLFFRR